MVMVEATIRECVGNARDSFLHSVGTGGVSREEMRDLLLNKEALEVYKRAHGLLNSRINCAVYDK